MKSSRWRTALAVCRLLPWFLAFGVLKRRVALPTLVRWAWRRPRDGPRADPSRIASLVLRTGAIAGTPDRDCLQRSLLLYRELAAGGLQPVLAVGLERMSGRLTGHAWVSLDGTALAEPDCDPARFETVVRFGEGGRPIA